MATMTVNKTAGSGTTEGSEVDLRITRTIALDPVDWARAKFRAHPRWVRDEPEPFDQEACVARLARLRTDKARTREYWSELEVAESLSREEAHFWFVATTEARGRGTTMARYAKRLGKGSYDGQIDPAEARRKLSEASRTIPPLAAHALAQLLTPEQYVDLVLDHDREHEDSKGYLEILLEGFDDAVFPYLDEATLRSLRTRIRAGLRPDDLLADPYEPISATLAMAAGLGMSEEIGAVVSDWCSDRFPLAIWSHEANLVLSMMIGRPHRLVLALESPERVESEWRRLGLRLLTPRDARTFLACTELSALDCLAESVLIASRKDRADALLEVLSLVQAPEAVPHMLACMVRSKAPARARQWLDTQLGNTVEGLLPVAVGRDRIAHTALDELRRIKQRGYSDLIVECLERADDPKITAKIRNEVLNTKDYQSLDAESLPDWLVEELNALGPPNRKKLPDWADPSRLPPLLVDDRQLADEHVAEVIKALMATPLGEQHRFLVAIRQHLSRHVRDPFAWALFQGWRDAGMPAKDRWALGAIGHLGDDACAVQLALVLREWPGQSQHARAKTGLECLRAIGSDVALMQLAGIARKLKYQGVKARAQELVDEIARERGLSREQLEDRIVPDCGLDEQGRREFSFGPRSFSFVLGGDLKPMVKDEKGKLRPSLPKPNAKDDPELAQRALDDWKRIKGQIKEVVRTQADRLEKAMVNTRRWVIADFEMFFVRHPLMTPLVQPLVWGAFDDDGGLLHAFRITEERDFADVQDEPLTFDDDVRAVGIVHPMELDDSARASWGDQLGDYELIPPFPQLGRDVYTLEPDEESQDVLRRFEGVRIPAPGLIYPLGNSGWTPGYGTVSLGGSDSSFEHTKRFETFGVTAVIQHEDAYSYGFVDPDVSLALGAVVFTRDPVDASAKLRSSKKLRLGKVPPIVLSEVLRTLHRLQGRSND